ncbi:Lactonase, 7-bladed beta-propeller-domain-containing protein [Mycena olivaceomarginata]|nr:Lactonase, 7-bladed beta-propeller-domain-containing protein [Mycena olivaceomarginata]
MVAFTIFAGGYDLFIAAYIFNTADSSLTLAAKYPSGVNCSWITGALQSFDISKGNVLSPAVDTVPSNGSDPAFCAALSTGEVAIMKLLERERASPDQFDNDAPTIVFPPPPPDTPNPNKVSHPHMAVQHGKEILSLTWCGSDMIWRLSPDGKPGVYSITGEIPQPLGSGPRHMRISNNRLYVLHELTSTLTVQAIPSFPNGTSTIISTASIIPANPPPGAVWAAAEILIPPPSARFPTQYIYVSNRNTGVQTLTGDSIAIFKNMEQGTPRERLQLVTQVFTGLDQIRGMEFGAADDEYLIAGGVAGTAGVVVYRRADGGRALEEVVRNTDIPRRTSFVWKELQS